MVSLSVNLVNKLTDGRQCSSICTQEVIAEISL